MNAPLSLEGVINPSNKDIFLKVTTLLMTDDLQSAHNDDILHLLKKTENINIKNALKRRGYMLFFRKKKQ